MTLYSKQAFDDLLDDDYERLLGYEVRDDGVYLESRNKQGKLALPFPFTLHEFLDFERVARVVAQMTDDELHDAAQRNPQAHELAEAARAVELREFWGKQEFWTLIEAACLLAKKTPRRESEFDKDLQSGGKAARFYRDLKDSTLAGTIKFVEVDGKLQRRRVTPGNAVGWAASRGLDVPPALTHLRGDYEDPLLTAARLQVETRRAAGRYTLEEVARELAENTGERMDAILSRLKEAAWQGELPMYGPGSKLRYRYGAGAHSQVREDYEEVRGRDINKWLTEHEPLISYRFPEQPSEPAPGVVEPSAPQATGALVRSDAGAEFPTRAGPEWIPAARELGGQWMLTEERRTGRRPTVVEIAKWLEGELLKRSILGRSRALDWETIKKEALTGITGRKKGENLKQKKGNPHRKRHSPIVKS